MRSYLLCSIGLLLSLAGASGSSNETESAAFADELFHQTLGRAAETFANDSSIDSAAFKEAAARYNGTAKSFRDALAPLEEPSFVQQVLDQIKRDFSPLVSLVPVPVKHFLGRVAAQVAGHGKVILRGTLGGMIVVAIRLLRTLSIVLSRLADYADGLSEIKTVSAVQIQHSETLLDAQLDRDDALVSQTSIEISDAETENDASHIVSSVDAGGFEPYTSYGEHADSAETESEYEEAVREPMDDSMSSLVDPELDYDSDIDVIEI